MFYVKWFKNSCGSSFCRCVFLRRFHLALFVFSFLVFHFPVHVYGILPHKILIELLNVAPIRKAKKKSISNAKEEKKTCKWIDVNSNETRSKFIHRNVCKILGIRPRFMCACVCLCVQFVQVFLTENFANSKGNKSIAIVHRIAQQNIMQINRRQWTR